MSKISHLPNLQRRNPPYSPVEGERLCRVDRGSYRVVVEKCLHANGHEAFPRGVCETGKRPVPSATASTRGKQEDREENEGERARLTTVLHNCSDGHTPYKHGTDWMKKKTLDTPTTNQSFAK